MLSINFFSHTKQHCSSLVSLRMPLFECQCQSYIHHINTIFICFTPSYSRLLPLIIADLVSFLGLSVSLVIPPSTPQSVPNTVHAKAIFPCSTQFAAAVYKG